MRICKNVSLSELDEVVERYNLECVGIVEGCLLDTGLYVSEALTVLAAETYVNEWTALYTVYIAATKNDSGKLFNRFYELEK